MDYKKILRLHYGNHLSSREIGRVVGVGKSTVNDFLKLFNACPVLTYPLADSITNEMIEALPQDRTFCLYLSRLRQGACAQSACQKGRDTEAPVAAVQRHWSRRLFSPNELPPVLQALL